jgi:hypothetical protein
MGCSFSNNAISPNPSERELKPANYLTESAKTLPGSESNPAYMSPLSITEIFVDRKVISNFASYVREEKEVMDAFEVRVR